MYEIYQRLLDERNLKNSDVSRATGISNMTLSDWKRGKSKPKQDKLKLIADFFNVSVDYLITGKDSDFTIEMADVDSQLIMMTNIVKEYAIKLSKLSEEDRKDIMKMIDRFLQ